jgi:hypothetical protein
MDLPEWRDAMSPYLAYEDRRAEFLARDERAA